MSRIGKIARLPQCLRAQLNRRLEDGEPGRQLVEWLNSCGAVQNTLAGYFGGRPISEQNLSEWKQGGFKDWQRHQETRAVAREFLAEAEELEEEIGDTPLTDRLTVTVALALARLLREAGSGESGPQQRNAILEIARELARLRKGDHQMERIVLEREILEQEQEARRDAELKAMRDQIAVEQIKTGVYGNLLRKAYCEALEAGTLDPGSAAEIRHFFVTHAEWLRKCGVNDLPASGSEAPSPPAESK